MEIWRCTAVPTALHVPFSLRRSYVPSFTFLCSFFPSINDMICQIAEQSKSECEYCLLQLQFTILIKNFSYSLQQNVPPEYTVILTRWLINLFLHNKTRTYAGAPTCSLTHRTFKTDELRIFRKTWYVIVCMNFEEYTCFANVKVKCNRNNKLIKLIKIYFPRMLLNSKY